MTLSCVFGQKNQSIAVLELPASVLPGDTAIRRKLIFQEDYLYKFILQGTVGYRISQPWFKVTRPLALYATKKWVVDALTDRQWINKYYHYETAQPQMLILNDADTLPTYL